MSIESNVSALAARRFIVPFAATLAVLITAGAAVVHRASTNTICTTSYSLTSTGIAHDWKTAPWSPSPGAGQYPGQNSGDCVSIGSAVQVTLQTATISLADFTVSSGTFGPAQVTFGSGASMTETAGTFSNSGFVTVDNGASATFSSASSQTVGGTTSVNGGTLTINDSFALTGQIQLHGGTINASRTL